MKNLLTITLCFISLCAFAQMQVDKKIEMTGPSSADKKIEGIEEVINDADAANKIYVDTAIANRASGGGGLDCPAGFTAVNDRYCIQTNESSSTSTWYNAIVACGDINARLCSSQEWYYACQKSGLGLSNMTGNWEWVGDQPGYYQLTGSDYLIVGSSSCSNSQVVDYASTSGVRFRCCFDR